MELGIGNPYQVLGVPVSATEQQIRACYRRLAAQHHPDCNPDDATANLRMGRINQAYALLSEPALPGCTAAGIVECSSRCEEPPSREGSYSSGKQVVKFPRACGRAFKWEALAVHVLA